MLIQVFEDLFIPIQSQVPWLINSSALVFFFSSRRRHTRLVSDWSSDVCSSDLRCPDNRVFGYGAFLGDVQGAQAEYVRVPNADFALHRIDQTLSDEEVLFAGDIFTTAYDCAIEARISKGDSVAVVGCGPVGLMAVQALRAFEPGVIYAVDTVSQRLEMAQTFGAVPIDADECHAPTHIQDHTDGRGVDAVLECVGLVP